MSDGTSVVIIFLNEERFLGEAIESVVHQTRADWELLLVDDGSTDASSAIAMRAAAAHPERIRYLEHPGHRNRGMSASRNLGAAAARGSHLFFLDADDVLLPHALETLREVLDREPRAAMAYGPLEHWYSWQESAGGRSDYVRALGVPAPTLFEPPELLVRFLSRRAAAPSGMMVRASALREVGGFEDSFRGMYEDQAFSAKVCLVWPVATTDVCGYRYRQHQASSTAQADRCGQHEVGREAFLRWLNDHLGRAAPRNPRVVNAVRLELWWLRHPRLYRLWRRLRHVPHRLTHRLRALGTPGGGSGLRAGRPAQGDQ